MITLWADRPVQKQERSSKLGGGVLLRIRIRNWKVEDQGSELHSQFLFAWLLGLLHLYCCYQTPDKKQLRRGEEEVI